MEAEAFMESNPDILKKGYFLPGSNGFLVICVHGFGGSPAEHYFTAKALNEAGYSVSVPLLKGTRNPHRRPRRLPLSGLD
jgi:esterase/lipase